MITRAFLLCLVLATSSAFPQQQATDYDYLYDDLITAPDLGQPVPQPTIVVNRPRSSQQASPAVRPPSRRPPPPQSSQARLPPGEEVSTTTHIPILKDLRSTDPATGAFIYEFMGADGSGKYEVRFPNGTVIGNFTYINDQGERETRWYSAGPRGTEIAGDNVISPAPPTLVDETTDPNYVDLSNYDLYRHLEVPYVHIAGPSDPDERGQLSSPPAQSQAPRRTQASQRTPPAQRAPALRTPPAPRAPPVPVAQPSQVPLDFGDDVRFVRVDQQQAQQAPQRPQTPSRVSRTRVRVVDPPSTQSRAQAHFNAGSIDNSSPDAVLDSLIRQFQK